LAVSGEYRAFISYSHADKAVAHRLHRALEHFRVPKRLIGRETPIGPVPHRIAPIFLDRSELPASGHLSSELEAALRVSRFLIPICTPNAVQSKWVSKEIEAFRAIHGADRILPLIAEGKAPACFPDALKADGAEPIAADMRPTADGWRAAVLKLAAGLLGVPYDELAQREAAERTRRARLVAGGSSTLAIAMAGLALVAVQARSEAESRRDQAEGLVEYMLTDLRQKLEPVGRLEVLDGVGQRALGYYAEQDAGEMDADALGRRARAQMLVGEVMNLRGNSAGALPAFRQAAAATGELLAREPDVPQRLYDHAQSRFWVGFIAWQRKDLASAEREFRGYLELAGRLVAMEPGNAEWQTELASAQTNLAILLDEEGRSVEAGTLFEAALRFHQRMLAAAPKDPTRLDSVGQTLAYLADNRAKRGEIAAAVAARRSERDAYARMLALDPADAEARDGDVMAGLAIGDLLTQQGDVQLALPELEASKEALDRLVQLDPENQRWRELAAYARFLTAEAALSGDDLRRARVEAAQAVSGAQALVAADPTVARWRQSRLLPARALEVRIARAAGDATTDGMEAAFRRDFAVDRFATAQARIAWLLTVQDVDQSDAARFGQLATTAREKALVERLRSAK